MAAQTLQGHACTFGKARGIRASAFLQDPEQCGSACTSSFGGVAQLRGSPLERSAKVTASKQITAGLVWMPEEQLRMRPPTISFIQWSALGFQSSSSPLPKPHFRSVDRPVGQSGHQLQIGWSNHSRRSRLRAQTEESKELETEKLSTGAPASTEPPFYSRPSFWVQSALVLFTLAYIDAAFSGDWSRIGVLSKETEANLRLGAYVVVPFSLIGAWWLGKIIKSYGSPRTR